MEGNDKTWKIVLGVVLFVIGMILMTTNLFSCDNCFSCVIKIQPL